MSVATTATSLYFVDSSLSDLDTLLQALPAGAEVVLLQPDQDGLAQMLDALAGREGIDALHVLTHGAPGSIQLGSTSLSLGTLAGSADTLSKIGAHLSIDADILFYGCSVAASDEGKAMVSQIAVLTGADVAASEDITGAAVRGGDWDLEVHSGIIEAETVSATAMDDVLASGIMKNKYVKFGYSDNGTLGYGGTTKPGIQYDKDGTYNFLDTADFLTPGSPWEMFAVKIGSSAYVNNNSSGATAGQMTTTLKSTNLTTSGNDTYGSITYESTIGGLKITQVYSLGQTSQVISMQVTIENVSGSTINDVKYARGTDPDVDSNGLPGSTSSTNNVRGATGIDAQNIVLATGPVSGRVIGLYTDSSFTHNTGVTGWSTDPSSYLSGTNVGNGDNTIGVGFDLGSFVAGQSKTFSFAYVFAASAADLQASVDEVPKSNPAPTLSYFTTPVDTTAEDTAVTITFAELIAQGNEADLNADNTPGTVNGFVVKQVNNGTLTIGGAAWAIGSNDVITSAKDAVWTPAANSNGTITAFSVLARDAEGAVSSGNVAVQVAVTAVNDRPTLVSNATLRAIAEDVASASNPGSTVADLFAPRFADVDSGAFLTGIVITANGETTLGDWQYSTDNGVTWHDVGSVSATAGLVLSTSSKLRFNPDADQNGVPSPLTVFALDDSYGTSFTSGATPVTFNTTTVTASSPLSTGSVTLGVEVTAVNDAPVFTSTAASGTVIETAADDTAVGSGVTLAATAGAAESGGKLTGTLAASDVDHAPESLTFSIRGGSEAGGAWTKQGLFGTLTLNADKTWSYELTKFAAINALPEGAVATESFDFKVADALGASAIQVLTITLTGTNDTPVLAAALADQTLTGTGNWQYQVPAVSFTDAEGTGLTYTVKVVAVGGVSLDVGDQYLIGASTSGGAGQASSWLTFDEGSRTFTGNPPSGWGDQSLTFEIVASDGSLSTSGSFTLNISGNSNQPPVVANPMQWTAADAPKEVTVVTFGAALGGTTVEFDGSGPITLGSKATGAQVATAFSSGTDSYTQTGISDNVLTLSAKVAGARSDFTNGGSVNVQGGSYTVAVTQEGADATTEEWSAQFAGLGGAGTLTVLGVDIVIVGTETADQIASAVVGALSADTVWNVSLHGTNTDTVVFTAKSSGTQVDLTAGNFSFTGVGDPLTGSGLVQILDGADAIAETVTLTFDGAYGGAAITIDGSTQSAGSAVTADDVATAVRGGAYSHYDVSGSGASVTFTAQVPGDRTDIQASDFTVTNAGGQSLSASPVVTDGSGWQVQVPLATFSDPDGDTLTYSAYSFTIDGAGNRTYTPIAAGDSAVPDAGGLLFDAATLKVFGDGSLSGAKYIEIRATDAGGSNGTAATEFQLVVYSNSLAASLSAVSNGVPVLVPFVDGAGSGSYTVPATAFNFAGESTNDAVFSLVAVDGSGNALPVQPAWLSIDSATGTITGNPPAGSADVIVKVTATSTVGGLSATTAPFTLVIDDAGGPLGDPNDPLQLTTPLPDQAAGDGGAISILVNKPFTDPDGAADGSATKSGITYTATANGQPLVNFGLSLEVDPAGNAGKLLITGNAPAGVAYLNIVVTGTETSGGDTESTSFTLNLGGTGTYSGAQRSNDTGVVTVTSNANIAAPKQGDILTAQAPTDADGVSGPVSYQWQVSTDGVHWTDVAGARGEATSLTLGQTEVGLQLRVQAFYLDDGGFAETPASAALPAILDVNDPGSVSMSAGSSVGSTISAVIADPDGLSSVTPSYQWQRADSEGGSYSNISGATYSSYTISSADGGKWLRVVTTYTDDQGNSETNITSPVRNINLSQIAPVAANVAGSATEAGGVANGTAGSDASGNLRTGATDANPGQAATLVVTGVRAGETEGLGRPANDGGATFTISGEFGDLVVNKATGAYTYTVAQGSEAVQALNSGDSLTEKFNFTLQDVDGLSDTGVLTITINGANDKPTISGEVATATVVEDVPTALPLDMLAIADPDSNALTLTLSVTSGTLRVNSLDDSVTVTGNDTGTLTLSVSSSPDALRGWLADNEVLYVSPPNQNGAVATLSYSINDGSGGVAASGTTAITATAANDAPLVDPDGNGATVGNDAVAVFKPRGDAVKIAAALTLGDIDASALNLTSATVTLVSGAIDNQYGTIYEKLSLSSAGEAARTSAGLTLNVTEGADSVVLTLTGSGSLAQYQAVLREVLYENSNPSAFTGDRGITISVTDADGKLGNAASFKTAVANNSIAVGQRIFINGEDSGAVVAVVEDNQHFIASQPLVLNAGDALNFYNAASQPTFQRNGDGSISLAGSDTPLTTAVVAEPLLATVTVQVPWTPVVDLNGELSGRDHSITFTEGQSGKAIATADSSITDQDGNLKQVTVTISNPVDGAAEKLFYTPAVAVNLAYLGITVTGNNTHSITFAANTDASQFQPWLRAIQYVNSSENPSVEPRQIVVTVTDAADNVGVPAMTTVTIIPVNDAPVKGGDFAGELNEGEVYVFTSADLNSTDVDNAAGTLKYVLTSTPAQGTLFRDTNNNGLVDAGEAIATVGDSSSIASINAIATGGYFTQAEVHAGLIKYAHSGQNPNGTNATGTDAFGFKVVDGMEDYAFANIAANQAGTVTLTVTEMDDAATGAPVISGTLAAGEVLNADVSDIADADGPVSPVFSYQWKVSSDGTTWANATGSGSTSSSYTVDNADQGKQIRVEVSFDDALGRSNTLSGDASGTVVYSNTPGAGAVSITSDGTPQAGEVLSADTSGLSDADGLGPIDYQWLVSTDGGATWTPIGGATGKTFTLPGDAITGSGYKAVVSYTDGRGNSESIESTPVTIVAPAADINDAPSLTGTGAFPATTTLFSDVAVSTVESGQLIQALTLTVSGIADVTETLLVDGEAVALVDTTTGTTVAGSVGYSVSLAGPTATLTLSHTGMTEAALRALVEGLALSGGTTAGLRVVTLISLQDNGGTAGGGADTGLIGISATVDVGDSLSGVPSSNTAPSVTTNSGVIVSEGGTVALTGTLAATDAEQSGLKVVLDSAPANGILFRDANNNGVADAGEELEANDSFALADITAGRIKYAHNGGETTSDSFTFNVSDGLALSDADGGTAGDQAATFSITVTAVDDAPTLVATPLGSGATPVAFAEGDAAVALFSGAASSPVETGENITGIQVMISGLRDGSAEKLLVDGSAFALTHGTAGSAGSVAYSVSVTGGTATVTLARDVDASTWNALIDGIAYENTSQNPTAGKRSITLCQVTETGGESSEVAVTSHVQVSPVNDAPTLTLNPITVTEGGSMTLGTAQIVAADVDTPLSSLVYTLSSAPAQGWVYLDANGNGVRDAGEDLADNATFTHAQLSSGKLRYQHDDGEYADSFAVSVSDGQGGSVGPLPFTVNTNPVNDAPSITGLGADVLAYPANSGGKLLEQGGDVVITDPDTASFNGGNLRVSITFNRDPAHDVLSIANNGTGAGQIGVAGGNVSYGGTVIGSYVGGVGTSDLVVSFNTNATHVAVSALIEAVQFANNQAAPANTSRTVSFALNDGQPGGLAAPVAVNVNIATGVTPSISIGNGFFVIENTQLVTALSATDPNARPITFSISGVLDPLNNPDAGKFEIVSGNILRFVASPDYETPTDSGGDNVYNVVIRATNDQGSYAEQTLAVTVLDQNPEGGVAVGDTSGPVFGYATVNGNALTMTYTDASLLDAVNKPGNSAFAVTSAGSPNAVSNVVVNAAAKTVTLTLTNAVTAGQAVTVAYTDPTAGNDVAALQDAAGNDAASLAATAVSNITPSSSGGGSSGGGSSGGGISGDGTGSNGTTVTNPDGSTTTTSTSTLPGGGTSTTVTTTTSGGSITTTTTTVLGDTSVRETVSTVSGTTVKETETNNTNGTTTILTSVAPFSGNGTGSGTATVSLATGSGAGGSSQSVLSATLPVGVGLTSEAMSMDGMTLRQQLISASNPRILNDPAFREVVDEGIDRYVETVVDSSQVTVRTITLTAGAQFSSTQSPIRINGGLGTGEESQSNPLRQEALVIDARDLPPGSVLRLDKVEFAIVIGALKVIGGEGHNFVVGDDADQYIVLGAGDDILRGGDGNDVVGSREGNDQIYGDAGDDWLVGGSGDDVLFGGEGNDLLHGGMSDAGTYRFSMGLDGNVRLDYTATHAEMAVVSSGTVDGNWRDSGGALVSDPRFGFVEGNAQVLQDVALIYQALIKQLPTVAALNSWSASGLDSQQLGQAAYGLYLAQHGDATLPMETQVAKLIEFVWGGTADPALASIGADYLAAGGQWGEVLLFLARNGSNLAAVTDISGRLKLAQDWVLGEVGWTSAGGNDQLFGEAGNDVLVAGSGSNLLDGGADIDLVVLFGSTEDWRITVNEQAQVVLTQRYTGAQNTLVDVELLQIGDTVFSLANASASTTDAGVAYGVTDLLALASAEEISLIGVENWLVS